MGSVASKTKVNGGSSGRSTRSGPVMVEAQRAGVEKTASAYVSRGEGALAMAEARQVGVAEIASADKLGLTLRFRGDDGNIDGASCDGKCSGRAVAGNDAEDVTIASAATEIDEARRLWEKLWNGGSVADGDFAHNTTPTTEGAKMRSTAVDQATHGHSDKEVWRGLAL